MKTWIFRSEWVYAGMRKSFLTLLEHPVYTVVVVPFFVTRDCVTSHTKLEHSEYLLSSA
jgi:hypothetical protein